MLWRTGILLSAVLFLGACSKRDYDDSNTHGCLGGPNACAPISGTPEESQSGSTHPATQTLACTAVAYPSQVMPAEGFRVQIDAYGGTGTKSIPGYINAFSGSTSIQGQFGAEHAGKVLRRTISVRDAAGNRASCEFAVEVLDGTSDNGFSCRLEVSPDVIAPGSVAQFTFSAVNPPGAVAFTAFQANANWPIPANLIQVTSPTQSTAQVQYDYAGTKIASVEAVSNGRRVLCRKTFSVGTPAAPTPGAPLTGCSAHTAPLGFPGDGSAASLAGNLTRVRATPTGGTGPFSLKLLEANGAGQYHLIGHSTTPASLIPQLMLRFQRPGAAIVRLELTDSLGRKTTCQTYHVSSPNDAFAVGAGSHTGSTGPLVKVYKGIQRLVVDQFQAFEASYRGHTRTALADFDGDGITDTLAATGPSSGQRIKLFKGTTTAWNSSKPTPTTLIELAAGLGPDGDSFVVGAGDITRDGRAEVIVASSCGAALPRLRVLSASDSSRVIANFEIPTFNHVRTGIASIAVADVDNDGYQDIIVSTCTTGAVGIFSGQSITNNDAASRGNTNVPLALRAFIAHPGYDGPFAVTAGDVNANGNMEIVVGSGDYSDIRYGDFAPPARVFDISTATTQELYSLPLLTNHRGLFDVGSADLNGDGYWEILATGHTQAPALTPSLEIHDGFATLQNPGQSRQSFDPIPGFLGRLFLGSGS